MTSSNGNIFRVTGPLCVEFIGPRWPRWIPITKGQQSLMWGPYAVKQTVKWPVIWDYMTFMWRLGLLVLSRTGNELVMVGDRPVADVNPRHFRELIVGDEISLVSVFPNLPQKYIICLTQGCGRHSALVDSISFFTNMMTSSNGNIFRVTGPLCGEVSGHRWIPLTKASDAEPWCVFDLCLE